MSKAQAPLQAEWTPDCNGKQDYDADLLRLSTRYWPRGGGYMVWFEDRFEENEDRPEIKPSAHAALLLQDTELTSASFEAETEEEVKQLVEAWADEQWQIACLALRSAFHDEGDCGATREEG
ncbi:MAG TPA: hypothetical protein VFH61_18085 [Thermoleophilia bacterium]|nr:hypothetical protein [Thermoleophilia bacterium]